MLGLRTSFVQAAALLGSVCALFVGAFGGCGSDDATTETPTSTTSVGGGGGGEQLNCVIDGVVGELEECDDGNMASGDGCEPDCSWTCIQGSATKGDSFCDDTDPCNGTETCGADHACAAGTPADDGTPCGEGKICKSQICGDDVCGDLYVSANEDCDDGNVVDGDGCDNCQFSCVASDPLACTPADPCEGQGTCDDNSHTCTPGTPLPDETPCGTDAYCQSGVCTNAVCGNGTLDPNEDCDDMNVVDGDGCDADCTLSCVNPQADCPSAPVCQMYTCSSTSVCQLGADSSQNGMTCGSNLVCQNGACIAPTAVCGNGILETGEQCDFGSANGPNAGCETTCTFSCTTAPDSCPDQNACNGVETCVQVTVNNQTGQKCNPGTTQPSCTACSGGLCQSGTCQPASCGDGCISGSEQCEPPSTSTCSATCTTVICGNGVREGSEQCDDGGTVNLDGCDATCKFEQDDRINWLKMQFSTDTYCTANQLGAAIVGTTARSELQSGLDDGIADGSISIVTKMLGLDDLTGTSDPGVQVGIMNGDPETALAPYNGNSDLDWWYYADPLSIDMNRNPTALLNGSIAAKVLDAGPGSVTIDILIGGNNASLAMSNLKLNVTLGATSVPLASMGVPPGHLAGENLDPLLVSYQNGGQQTTNGSGRMCGNISAASLAQVPIPAELTGGGLLACTQNYSTANTMLDLLVGGCTVLFIQQIAPKQPDQQDPGAPPAGNGPPYTLQANSTTKVVSTCRDATNQVVPLAACLADAAYSSFFRFATGRVIVK